MSDAKINTRLAGGGDVLLDYNIAGRHVIYEPSTGLAYDLDTGKYLDQTDLDFVLEKIREESSKGNWQVTIFQENVQKARLARHGAIAAQNRPQGGRKRSAAPINRDIGGEFVDDPRLLEGGQPDSDGLKETATEIAVRIQLMEESLHQLESREGADRIIAILRERMAQLSRVRFLAAEQAIRPNKEVLLLLCEEFDDIFDDVKAYFELIEDLVGLPTLPAKAGKTSLALVLQREVFDAILSGDKAKHALAEKHILIYRSYLNLTQEYSINLAKLQPFASPTVAEGITPWQGHYESKEHPLYMSDGTVITSDGEKHPVLKKAVLPEIAMDNAGILNGFPLQRAYNALSEKYKSSWDCAFITMNDEGKITGEKLAEELYVSEKSTEDAFKQIDQLASRRRTAALIMADMVDESRKFQPKTLNDCQKFEEVTGDIDKIIASRRLLERKVNELFARSAPATFEEVRQLIEASHLLVQDTRQALGSLATLFDDKNFNAFPESNAVGRKVKSYAEEVTKPAMPVTEDDRIAWLQGSVTGEHLNEPLVGELTRLEELVHSNSFARRNLLSNLSSGKETLSQALVVLRASLSTIRNVQDNVADLTANAKRVTSKEYKEHKNLDIAIAKVGQAIRQEGVLRGRLGDNFRGDTSIFLRNNPELLKYLPYLDAEIKAASDEFAAARKAYGEGDDETALLKLRAAEAHLFQLEHSPCRNSLLGVAETREEQAERAKLFAEITLLIATFSVGGLAKGAVTALFRNSAVGRLLGVTVEAGFDVAVPAFANHAMYGEALPDGPIGWTTEVAMLGGMIKFVGGVAKGMAALKESQLFKIALSRLPARSLMVDEAGKIILDARTKALLGREMLKLAKEMGYIRKGVWAVGDFAAEYAAFAFIWSPFETSVKMVASGQGFDISAVAEASFSSEALLHQAKFLACMKFGNALAKPLVTKVSEGIAEIILKRDIAGLAKHRLETERVLAELSKLKEEDPYGMDPANSDAWSRLYAKLELLMKKRIQILKVLPEELQDPRTLAHAEATADAAKSAYEWQKLWAAIMVKEAGVFVNEEGDVYYDRNSESLVRDKFLALGMTEEGNGFYVLKIVGEDGKIHQVVASPDKTGQSRGMVAKLTAEKKASNPLGKLADVLIDKNDVAHVISAQMPNGVAIAGVGTGGGKTAARPEVARSVKPQPMMAEGTQDGKPSSKVLQAEHDPDQQSIDDIITREAKVRSADADPAPEDYYTARGLELSSRNTQLTVFGRIEDNVTARVADRSDSSKPIKILTIGPGAGNMEAELKAQFGNDVIIDTFSLTDHVSPKNRDAFGHIYLGNLDLSHLPRGYDLIISISGTYHAVDQNHVASEIIDSLAVGGEAYFEERLFQSQRNKLSTEALMDRGIFYFQRHTFGGTAKYIKKSHTTELSGKELVAFAGTPDKFVRCRVRNGDEQWSLKYNVAIDSPFGQQVVALIKEIEIEKHERVNRLFFTQEWFNKFFDSIIETTRAGFSLEQAIRESWNFFSVLPPEPANKGYEPISPRRAKIASLLLAPLMGPMAVVGGGGHGSPPIKHIYLEGKTWFTIGSSKDNDYKLQAQPGTLPSHVAIIKNKDGQFVLRVYGEGVSILRNYKSQSVPAFKESKQDFPLIEGDAIIINRSCCLTVYFTGKPKVSVPPEAVTVKTKPVESSPSPRVLYESSDNASRLEALKQARFSFDVGEVLRKAVRTQISGDDWKSLNAIVRTDARVHQFIVDEAVRMGSGVEEVLPYIGSDNIHALSARCREAYMYADALRHLGETASADTLANGISQALRAEGLKYDVAGGIVRVAFGESTKFASAPQTSAEFEGNVAKFVSHPNIREKVENEVDPPVEEEGEVASPRVGERTAYQFANGAIGKEESQTGRLGLDVIAPPTGVVGPVDISGFRGYLSQHGSTGEIEGRLYISLSDFPGDYGFIVEALAREMKPAKEGETRRRSAQGKFYFKHYPRRGGRNRNDQFVIYFNSENEAHVSAAVLNVIRAFKQKLEREGRTDGLRNEGPWMSLQIEDGVFFGEEPLGKGKSFSSLRADTAAKAFNRIQFYKAHGVILTPSDEAKIFAYYFNEVGIDVTRDPSFNIGGREKFVKIRNLAATYRELHRDGDGGGGASGAGGGGGGNAPKTGDGKGATSARPFSQRHPLWFRFLTAPLLGVAMGMPVAGGGGGERSKDVGATPEIDTTTALELANIKVGGRPIRDVIGDQWYRTIWYRNVMKRQTPAEAVPELRGLADGLNRITVNGRLLIELFDVGMLKVLGPYDGALTYLVNVAGYLNRVIGGRPFYDWLGGVDEAGKLVRELGLGRLNELSEASELLKDIADSKDIKPEELRKAILDGEDAFYDYYLHKAWGAGGTAMPLFLYPFVKQHVIDPLVDGVKRLFGKRENDEAPAVAAESVVPQAQPEAVAEVAARISTEEFLFGGGRSFLGRYWDGLTHGSSTEQGYLVSAVTSFPFVLLSDCRAAIVAGAAFVVANGAAIAVESLRNQKISEGMFVFKKTIAGDDYRVRFADGGVRNVASNTPTLEIHLNNSLFAETFKTPAEREQGLKDAFLQGLESARRIMDATGIQIVKLGTILPPKYFEGFEPFVAATGDKPVERAVRFLRDGMRVPEIMTHMRAKKGRKKFKTFGTRHYVIFKDEIPAVERALRRNAGKAKANINVDAEPTVTWEPIPDTTPKTVNGKGKASTNPPSGKGSEKLKKADEKISADHLASKLEDPKEEVHNRIAAAEALGNVKDADVKVLERAMRGSLSDLRLPAARSWAKFATREELVRALTEEGKFFEVRAEAAARLGQLESDPETVKALELSLKNDASSGVRTSAVLALGELKSTASKDALVHVLENDESQGVRVAAVHALVGVSGRVDIEKALKEAYSEEIRIAAAISLGELKDPRSLEALEYTLSNDQSRTVRFAVAEALDQVSPGWDADRTKFDDRVRQIISQVRREAKTGPNKTKVSKKSAPVKVLQN